MRRQKLSTRPCLCVASKTSIQSTYIWLEKCLGTGLQQQTLFMCNSWRHSCSSTAEFQCKVFLCICKTIHVTYLITNEAEFKRKASRCVSKQIFHQTYTHQTAQVLETWSHKAYIHAMLITTCPSHSLNNIMLGAQFLLATTCMQLSFIQCWSLGYQHSEYPGIPGSIYSCWHSPLQHDWLLHVTAHHCNMHACSCCSTGWAIGQMFGLMHTWKLHRHGTLWVKACAQDLLAAACMSLYNSTFVAKHLDTTHANTLMHTWKQPN